MARTREKLIIDCDPGHDDALALLLAHHVADVVGITTVSGNAPLPAVTRNALALVALIGAATPVHSGADRPLIGEPRHAAHVHGADGLGGTALPGPTADPAGQDAAGFLLEASRLHPGCWIVALGPLTNLALALDRDPMLIERVQGISLMGGSTAGGNATATAEFNVLADPEAADRVFRSGAVLRMCGLNLTHQFETSDDLVDTLRRRDSPQAAFAADALTYLHDRMEVLRGSRRAALHDPCAVLAAVAPALFEFQPRHVAVELDGRLTRGMTVVDERPGPAVHVPNTEVAYRLDAAAAQRMLLAALGA
jgi:inosine-uridine nucleoside N-ribohydrolase